MFTISRLHSSHIPPLRNRLSGENYQKNRYGFARLSGYSGGVIEY